MKHYNTAKLGLFIFSIFLFFTPLAYATEENETTSAIDIASLQAEIDHEIDLLMQDINTEEELEDFLSQEEEIVSGLSALDNPIFFNNIEEALPTDDQLIVETNDLIDENLDIEALDTEINTIYGSNYQDVVAQIQDNLTAQENTLDTKIIAFYNSHQEVIGKIKQEKIDKLRQAKQLLATFARSSKVSLLAKSQKVKAKAEELFITKKEEAKADLEKNLSGMEQEYIDLTVKAEESFMEAEEDAFQASAITLDEVTEDNLLLASGEINTVFESSEGSAAEADINDYAYSAGKNPTSRKQQHPSQSAVIPVCTQLKKKANKAKRKVKRTRRTVEGITQKVAKAKSLLSNDRKRLSMAKTQLRKASSKLNSSIRKLSSLRKKLEGSQGAQRIILKNKIEATKRAISMRKTIVNKRYWAVESEKKAVKSSSSRYMKVKGYLKAGHAALKSDKRKARAAAKKYRKKCVRTAVIYSPTRKGS